MQIAEYSSVQERMFPQGMRKLLAILVSFSLPSRKQKVGLACGTELHPFCSTVGLTLKYLVVDTVEFGYSWLLVQPSKVYRTTIIAKNVSSITQLVEHVIVAKMLLR